MIKRKRGRSKSFMRRLLSFLLPAAVGIIAIAWLVVPMGMAVMWSLVNPDYPWTYPQVWPTNVSLYQWKYIFSYTNITGAILNSLIIASVTTLICAVISLPTAYALGRYDIKYKSGFKIIMLVPMFFPGMALALFLGRSLFMLGASQSYLGIIMAHTLICLPYMLRILTASFETMPQDLIDAASNLGADNWVKLTELYLPMIAPGMVAGAIFSFIESMQEFNLAFIIGVPSVQTIPTILYSYMGNSFLRTSASVVTLIMLIPNICLLFLTEKFIKTEHLGAALGKM